mgnify:CR=1 FL=1
MKLERLWTVVAAPVTTAVTALNTTVVLTATTATVAPDSTLTLAMLSAVQIDTGRQVFGVVCLNGLVRHVQAGRGLICRGCRNRNPTA